MSDPESQAMKGDFQQKEINYCEVFTQRKKSIIYYNPKIVDNESIAYELLHIWLKKLTMSLEIIFSISTSSKAEKNIHKIFM